MLAPVRTVAPAVKPMTIEEAKAAARIDHSDDDAVVTSLIAAATDYLDGWSGILGRALVNQTWRQDFAGFNACLRLPLAPVSPDAEITITYYDADNTQQTLATATWQRLTDERGPYIALKPGETWPRTYPRPDAVSVTFVAGYGANGSAVPEAIRHAILLTVAYWYDQRETAADGQLSEIPFGASALIAPYRRVSV